MGRGILRGAGGDENLKFNFIWPYLLKITKQDRIDQVMNKAFTLALKLTSQCFFSFMWFAKSSILFL